MSNYYYYAKRKGYVENARAARIHTDEMELAFKPMITQSVEDTKVYNDGDVLKLKHAGREQALVFNKSDSVHALFEHNEGKVALLNFASYKRPGGKFLIGGINQEASLCHASFLYNVLARYAIHFYDWNNNHKNKGLYYNRALYTPDVAFLAGRQVCFCDVINCASPDRKIAIEHCGVSAAENLSALDERIRFILSIAVTEKVDTLILGAFGCGPLGQNPYDVALSFKKHLVWCNCFQKIVFAIPDENILQIFREVFAQAD